MNNIYKKFFSILSLSQKRNSLILLLLVLTGVFLEMLGISLILPILSLLIDSGANQSVIGEKIISFFSFLGATSTNEFIVVSLILLVGVYLFKNLFLVFIAWFQAKFINSLLANISGKLFYRYLFQDYIFHIHRNSSKLIQNIIGEIPQLINVFFLSFIVFTTETLIVIGISIILLIIEPVGFLIVFALFGFISFIFIKYTKRMVQSWGVERQKNQYLSLKHVQQSLRGIKDLKLLGVEKEFYNFFQFYINKNSQINTKKQFFDNLPRFFLEFIAVSALITLVTVLIVLDYTSTNILVVVGIFAAAAFKILPSVNRLVNSFQNMRYSLVVLDTIHEDLKLDYQKILDKNLRNKKLKFDKNIEIKNLFFKYPESKKETIVDINLNIPINSTIGFIGPSGSGKTTLIDLIIGILKPDKGFIQVDDQNINNNIRNWQNNIGYVPQEIYLTDDTIIRNIALGINNENIDDLKINNALQVSKLNNFVNSLPKKEQTPSR